MAEINEPDVRPTIYGLANDTWRACFLLTKKRPCGCGRFDVPRGIKGEALSAGKGRNDI